VIQESQRTLSQMHSITGLPLLSVKESADLLSETTKELEVRLENEVNRLSNVVAEMKGQVIAKLENQANAIEGINEKLDMMQTRREAEKSQEEHLRRIDSLEQDRKWLVRQILGIWFAGIITAVTTAITILRKTF